MLEIHESKINMKIANATSRDFCLTLDRKREGGCLASGATIRRG